MIRQFAGLDFKLLGAIEVDCHNGQPVEFMPQDRYSRSGTTARHAYGNGPFCRFRIGRGIDQPGLYVLTIDSKPVYVGECDALSKRWSLAGYGSISPRNCYAGGQQTNCRINAAILHEAKQRRPIELWFRPGDRNRKIRRVAENDLVDAIQPIWNRKIARQPVSGAND